MTYRNPLSPRTREHAVALYDGEIATADRALGRLLRAMEERGDLANTWIVFTSDHGESLLEHGYFFNHGDFVYGPAANVPFLWRGPGSRPGLTSRTPSLVEIVPTILGFVGLEDDSSNDSPGNDVARFGESGFCRFPDLNDRLGFQLPPEIAQSPDEISDWRETWEAQANRAKQRFVEIGSWKLVRSPHEAGDVSELFDLSTDPGETTNVASAHPALVRELDAALDEWVRAGESAISTAEDRTLDAAARDRLRGLGYLGN
jgi:arylsulfatase A-like enzyme